MKTSVAAKVKAISTIRNRIDESVAGIDGVIGSMIGLKMTGGILTKRVGITYLVRKKVPTKELPPEQRIPDRLKIDGTWVNVDVIEWPLMREQAGNSGLITFDGRKPGTLSCFATSPNGVFGISCAHCLAGADGNPSTPSPVSIYQPGRSDDIASGTSYWSVSAPGPGLPKNFGYLDCGLIAFTPSEAAALTRNASAIHPVDDIGSLTGQRVFATNALRSSAGDNFRRTATIWTVDKVALGERADVVLLVDPPGTFIGDSGLLWRTRSGMAVAIHARGELILGGQGSRLTTAMAVHRARSALAVDALLF